MESTRDVTPGAPINSDIHQQEASAPLQASAGHPQRKPEPAPHLQATESAPTTTARKLLRYTAQDNAHFFLRWMLIFWAGILLLFFVTMVASTRSLSPEHFSIDLSGESVYSGARTYIGTIIAIGGYAALLALFILGIRMAVRVRAYTEAGIPRIESVRLNLASSALISVGGVALAAAGFLVFVIFARPVFRHTLSSVSFLLWILLALCVWLALFSTIICGLALGSLYARVGVIWIIVGYIVYVILDGLTGSRVTDAVTSTVTHVSGWLTAHLVLPLVGMGSYSDMADALSVALHDSAQTINIGFSLGITSVSLAAILTIVIAGAIYYAAQWRMSSRRS
ncbi:MAG: hypothetical protein SPI12_03355 [Actinomycetaceae bacterium]|nr:hypothetical protein [Actinomycetaceae bacterium]MDY6082883.1 hypothetical protein [Actinomycetaceae bacterium]